MAIKTKTFYFGVCRNLLFSMAFCLLFTNVTFARVIPAACFTNNMVLQQKTSAAIWGTEKAGRTVTVTTSWNNKKYMVVADDAGNWKVKVATPSYGGPYAITFDDGEVTTLNNVLIGEVWVCSGQSNMEMQLAGYGGILNLDKELAEAANYPQIRMLKIDNKTSFQPRTDVPVKWGWTICDSKSVGDFSAVAYFFAKNFYYDKHIPVGIINSTWGGTVAEAWTSGDALKTMPEFASFVKETENGLTQEKLDQKYKDDVQAWLRSIDTKDPAYQNGKLAWAMAGFDDSSWKHMTLPTYWEQAGLPNYDGTVWFRKTVKLPSAWAGKELKLNIDGIDDYDDSFFNGSEVGHTELFIFKRSYTIPANLVKAGDNTIAIRVFDNGGLGGINKGPMSLSVVGDTAAKIDLAGEWSYHPATGLKELPQPPVNPTSANRPTIIYNAMISPIEPYTIKGVIWYQGESNADRPYQYEKLFPLLITDWRQKWGEGNFPFYFVQIANYSANDQPPAADWPALRYAQLKTLSLPNTGMAVTIDIGDYNRIHPQNKQEVGRRLALIARAKTYGENIPYSGPIYQSQKVEGNKVILSFKYTNGGLVAKGDTLKGFTIAGADKVFHPAMAVIKGNKIEVSGADVANPVAVRYAWANFPNCNLYNGAGLPASPFKTDDWQGVR